MSTTPPSPTSAGTVARELVELVEHCLAPGPPRTIDRAFVPPARRTGRDADFGWLRLDDGSIGFFYAWLDGRSERLLGGLDPGTLRGCGVGEVARGLLSDHPARRALGLAAINAASHSLFRAADWVPGPAGDSIGRMQFHVGDRVGMVGYFSSLAARLVEQGVDLVVVEKKRELLEEPAPCRVTLDPAALAECNKILCTGATLLNESIDEILALTRGAERFVMIGPTASCLPDPLFARGCDMIGGVAVVAEARMEYRLQCGAPWGDAVRKYVISGDDYPGADALAARAFTGSSHELGS